ncbi:MAG: YfhO family protein [Sediminibacterium sp.]|nr:YfhO family protein [Sediminibacterium sp.]
MSKNIFKSLLPHLLAIFIFAIVAIVYCKPALEGKVLQQSDVTQWKGMAQDALNYKAQYGITPLWTNSMFGGMPTFQITGIPVSPYSIGALDGIFSLYLAEPVGLFFLASICFYFLAQVLGFSTLIGIIGGLAYSYATYNPIIVVVGHMTKMHAIAYLPFFIGAILLIFQKKYYLGAICTAIATALFVQANHLQINYYGLIIVLAMSLFYLIQWIKAKEYTHILKTIGFSLVAGIMGLAVNAIMLMSTAEYGKASIRGGSALATKDSKITNTGLNKDYALSYSMFLSEPLVMMFPHIYGASSDPNLVDPAKSKAIEVLQQMQPEVGQQLQSFLQFYWGGIGFTAGPPYVGIIICFLACIGFGSNQNPNRWWIGSVIVLSILLAAGSYFETFNLFILEHLPLYNKFRAPSMIIVVPTLLIGVLAMYGIHAIVKATNFKQFIQEHKTGWITLGLVFFAVLALYFTSDFKSESEKQLMSQIMQIQDPNQKAAFETPARDMVNAIAEDRKGFIESDLIRALIFIGIAFLLIYLYIKQSIQQTIFIAGIGLLTLVDLFQINVQYLKPSQYVEATENENVFALTDLDKALLKDTSNYRIIDLRRGVQNAFNEGAIMAYHHKLVGGYNPAKLSIYQDLIENQWYQFPNCLPTLNMMNTKYIITGNMASDTIPNPDALGNAWFVKGIDYKKGPRAVMDHLSFFNPRDSAVMDEQDKIDALSGLQVDTTARIQLVDNQNDVIHYTATTNAKQLAVFSEIYYRDGWKAYIDEQETPIVKVNYVLRGLVVPAGDHKIRFEFKPASVTRAKQIAGIASILVWLALIAFIVVAIKQFMDKQKAAL